MYRVSSLSLSFSFSHAVFFCLFSVDSESVWSTNGQIERYLFAIGFLSSDVCFRLPKGPVTAAMVNNPPTHTHTHTNTHGWLCWLRMPLAQKRPYVLPAPGQLSVGPVSRTTAGLRARSFAICTCGSVALLRFPFLFVIFYIEKKTRLAF